MVMTEFAFGSVWLDCPRIRKRQLKRFKHGYGVVPLHLDALVSSPLLRQAANSIIFSFIPLFAHYCTTSKGPYLCCTRTGRSSRLSPVFSSFSSHSMSPSCHHDAALTDTNIHVSLSSWCVQAFTSLLVFPSFFVDGHEEGYPILV